MNAQTEMTLLPCQFCGGSDLGIYSSDFQVTYHGECHDCGAKGPTDEDQTKAIEAWNRRAHLTKPDAGGGDHVRDATKLIVQPSVVPMPPTEHCRYRVAWGDGDTVIVEATGQRDVIETIHYLSVETAQAYADARVSEATRELVDALNISNDLIKTTNGQSAFSDAIDLIIAKYTQTQKESK